MVCKYKINGETLTLMLSLYWPGFLALPLDSKIVSAGPGTCRVLYSDIPSENLSRSLKYLGDLHEDVINRDPQ